MNKIILTALAVATSISAFAQVPQLRADNIDEVVGAMTLEEKATLVVGSGMLKGMGGGAAVVGSSADLVPGAAGSTCPIERLGIPAAVLADGPAGLRINPKRDGTDQTFYCTHFPIGTLLACTWNVPLVESVGGAIGNEVLEYGADVLLAPGMNIHRNPLNGRNFEYYSEDPLVTGKIAAAYVRGIQSNGVGVSSKHFAVNSQESNRQKTDARVSERALREIYLRGFERMVKESNPWTLMSSYNYINGIYASENEDMLQKMLRDEWGFKGIVMTDWFGGTNPVAQMVAGNDLLEPGIYPQYQAIVNGVKEGKLDEKILDRNVKRILELIVKTPRFKGYKFSNKPDLKAHAAVTRQSATEGMVLLKNENTLPIAANNSSIALFGCTSYDFIAGGTGSGNVNRAYTVSMLEGLINAGYKVDDTLQPLYEKYIAEEKERNTDHTNFMSAFFPTPRPKELIPTPEQLREAVAKNDVAIITLGRISGEFLDRTPADFNLKAEENELIKVVSDAFHKEGKKVVVVLNIGGVVETTSWSKLPDAILLAWQAGQEGGNSVADILCGAANPSGKLSMTWPIAYADHASSANFPTDGRAPKFSFNPTEQAEQKEPENLWDYTNYEEDIYVGYRYFDTFGKDVAFPFGYGLSYTKFDYSNSSISEKDGIYTISVDVKNVGKVAGKEVVQVYATAPDAKVANKPEHELRAFAKTDLLAPNATQRVTLTIPATDLASYNDEKSAWVVTSGEYNFCIGASSRDIRASLKADVKGCEKPVKHLLVPQTELKLLKR